ncbi:MAG: hypothetical protein ACI4UM_00090 [Succinivibrio sp.]
MNKALKTLLTLTAAGALVVLSEQAMAKPHHPEYYAPPYAVHHGPKRHHHRPYHAPLHHKEPMCPEFAYHGPAPVHHDGGTQVIVVNNAPAYHHAPPPHPNMHGGPLYDILAAAEHLARAADNK